MSNSRERNAFVIMITIPDVTLQTWQNLSNDLLGKLFLSSFMALNMIKLYDGLITYTSRSHLFLELQIYVSNSLFNISIWISNIYLKTIMSKMKRLHTHAHHTYKINSSSLAVLVNATSWFELITSTISWPCFPSGKYFSLILEHNQNPTPLHLLHY